MCPLSPPPSLTRRVPKGMSSSSWTATSRSGGDLVERGSALTGPPTRSCSSAAGPGRRAGRGARAARAGPRPPRRGRTCGPRNGEPSRRQARRRRGSRRCAGGRRTPGRGCPARRPARPRSRSLLRESPSAAASASPPSAASSAAASAASALVASSDSSRSMPASASASSSSASRASSALLLGDVDDQRLRVDQQRASPRQREVGGQDLGAGLGALDRDLDVLGDVGGLGLDLHRGVLGDDQGLGGGLADEVDRDVDGDLLAEADGDEVDVLE